MQKTLNIAVIGCGYWGPNLIRNFNSLQECKVRLVCDGNHERLAYIKQHFRDVDVTTDFHELLNDDIEAVVIATPVKSHYNLAKQALLAKKHVFIEKPMASSVQECQELIAIAKQLNLRLMVGHTFVYTAAVRSIKEIINSGQIGELFYISSQRLNLGLFQKDINVAWDLAPHDISIILYLLNYSPLSVNCQGKAHIQPGIEDIINMSLHFPNNMIAMIQNSWLDPNKIRTMTIVGSKGMIVYDDIAQLEKIKIYDKRVEVPAYYETFGDFQYSYHYGDMRAPYLKQIEPLRVECQHFVDCVRTQRQPESSGLEGMKVVQILEAATQSLKSGGGNIAIEDLYSRDTLAA